MENEGIIMVGYNNPGHLPVSDPITLESMQEVAPYIHNMGELWEECGFHPVVVDDSLLIGDYEPTEIPETVAIQEPESDTMLPVYFWVCINPEIMVA